LKQDTQEGLRTSKSGGFLLSLDTPLLYSAKPSKQAGANSSYHDILNQPPIHNHFPVNALSYAIPHDAPPPLISSSVAINTHA
jgi:hypothetical protein